MNDSCQPAGYDTDNNPLGILTLDDSLRINGCNSNFRNIFDCTEHDTDGVLLEELFSDKDKKGLTDFHRNISQYQSGFLEQAAHLQINQRDYYTHLRLLKKCSGWLVFLENLYNDESSLIGNLVQCQGRFKSVIRNASDGIVILDENNELIEFNKVFFEILAIHDKQGIPINEDAIIGRNFFDLTEPGFTDVQAIIATARLKKKAQLKQAVNYKCYSLALDITPIFQPVKGFIGTGIVLHDQTAHHQLKKLAEELAENEIKLAKAKDTERLELESQLRQAQKMEAIGQLTGGIAHDFNNLLTGVLGNANLGLEAAADFNQSKLQKYLKNILRSGERARELIRQMLVFSRGQRGEPRIMSLESVVFDALKLLESSLPSSVEIEVEISEGTGNVKLDPLQIEQVLMNLCINAHDAMDAAGNVTISLHSRNDLKLVCTACSRKFSGDFVELVISDSGPGIDQQTIERMFEPFFTTKEVGKGTGMGLSMVHGIVHEHDGHIIVESKPNSGATFRLLFPLVSANQKLETPEQYDIMYDGKPSVLKGRVLLVDDEELVAEFMQDLLESRGLTVTTKTCSNEAQNAFLQDPESYDLIITDQTMPKITGIELAQSCLRIKPGIPIILYTGHSEKLSEEHVLELGICGVLKKPVDIDALMQTLRNILGPSEIQK